MVEKDTLIKIIGDENVFDDPEILGQFARDESLVRAIKPRYVVKPENSDQIVGLIKWANETLTPLVPMSSGAPHFRGDTVASTGGAIIIDLSRMKRIIRVDGRNRVTLIEPGVTFANLIPELEKEKIRLNLPLLPRISKSVIGSVLEREPVIMPKYHWDIVDPLLSTEIIFGTGDAFKTGSAAGPRTLEEQWKLGRAQKVGAGPSQVDWYRLFGAAQGTMGIVTWASIRCERLPVVDEPFLVGSADLNKLFEFVHWLIRLRLANECLVLNKINLAAILAKEWPEGFERFRETLPSWLLFFSIAGYEYFPEERVSYQTKDMFDVAKRVGVEPVKSIGEISAPELLKVLRLPSQEPYWKLRYKGSCYDIFFLTTQDKLSDLIGIMSDSAVKHHYPIQDMGVYIQPVVQGTSCHCEFNLFFNPDQPAEVNRIQEISTDVCTKLMNNGAFFSRPYGAWADMAYRRDAETTIALRKIKQIFDPNNVMNPGKLCF